MVTAEKADMKKTHFIRAVALSCVGALVSSQAHAGYSDEDKDEICKAVMEDVRELIVEHRVGKHEMYDEIVPSISDPLLRNVYKAVAAHFYRGELRGNDRKSLRRKLNKACVEELEQAE